MSDPVPPLSDILEVVGAGLASRRHNPTMILHAAEFAFATETPDDFEWFAQRERSGETNDEVMHLLNGPSHEHGWALAQLFYDQTLKKSVQRGARCNLAHPAFGIAQAAAKIGHTSAHRHYATVALIADILGEPDDYHGGAAFVLSNRSGWSLTERFTGEMQLLAADSGFTSEPAATGVRWPEPNRPGMPIYPEALLAASWFPGHARIILSHATAKAVPFVDLLLEEARLAVEAERVADSGTLFEAAAALLLSGTPGFEVRGGYKDASSQTDIVVAYRRDPFCEAFFPEGYALVECKFWNAPVDAHTIREFGARCLLQDIHLGILVTRNGVTGDDRVALRDAELERRRFMARGTHILVLASEDMRRKARELRGLEGVLKEDLERLRFGERH